MKICGEMLRYYTSCVGYTYHVDCRLAEGCKLDGGRDERDILYIVSRGRMYKGRSEQSKS